ncbi:alpha/beta fold hydrolase [Escherichia coli]|uniref:alpha/beta fold hydrolase n=1 Tax=Escherichia coli TaxID=562 RepID=UPI0011DDF317|nr:alpha/beta hydrolase [Escherichia coli]NEV43014.1 alpha/beta hydrolase [Escherichia coli]TXX19361.1 alpha/beta hydrolase [Escherichia coli]
MNINYIDSGENLNNSDKPVVIFVHGFFMDSRMFLSQFSEISKKNRVICVDVRGFGKNSVNIETFSLYDIVDDISKIVKKSNIKKFILCGMSMGGYVALRMAISQFDELKGLILISTQYEQDTPDIITSYNELCDNWENPVTKETIINSLLPIFFGDCEKQSQEWKKIWLEHHPENIRKAMAAMINRDDINDKICKINVPTLIIHGENDVGIPSIKSQNLKNKIHNSELFLIPEGNHALPVTHPVVINRIITTWLHKNNYRF